MEKINELLKEREHLRWLATSWFENFEELDEFHRRCAEVDHQIEQILGKPLDRDFWDDVDDREC